MERAIITEDSMPRPRPPHLHRQVTRHGRTVWYVRIDHGPRIRIRSAFGTPEFWAEYHAACAGRPLPRIGDQQNFKPATLGWLIERYRESGNAEHTWGVLSPGTRRLREAYLKDACRDHGHVMLAQITSASIEKGMAKRAPSRAKHFLDTFRGLFKWAVKAQHCAHNPTAGLQAVLPESDGHPPWSNEWCRKFEARWPHGTRERLAYELLYWTGLRIGDAVRFGRQHVNKDGMGIIETEKTGELANVPMSKLPRLLAALAAGPTGDLTFIVSARGRPLNKFAFGAFVRRAARLAGVPGSAHGLRKTRSTLITEAGGSDAELEAWMGWSRGSAMAKRYTDKFNRAEAARRAAEKLQANENRTSIPSPRQQVRAPRRERQ